MEANGRILAYICNDLQNAEKYRIDESDNKCYYEDEYIGDIGEQMNGDVFSIYLKPIKPVESINVNITLNNP